MGSYNYCTDWQLLKWFDIPVFCKNEEDFKYTYLNENEEEVEAFDQYQCDEFMKKFKEILEEYNKNHFFNFRIEYGYYDGLQIMYDEEATNNKLDELDYNLSENIWKIINEKELPSFIKKDKNDFKNVAKNILKLNYIYGDKIFEGEWGYHLKVMDILKDFYEMKKFLIKLQNEYGFRCRTNGWVTHELPLIA